MTRPEPKNRQIKLNPKRYIVSKTDAKGVIEYGNDYFVEVSGYSEAELIGKPHSILRHPDMPRVIFKMMWDRISRTQNITAVVKNLAKDGSYYWVITEFEPKVDPVTNEIISHTAFRKAAPQAAVDAMEPIYKKLLVIEEDGGVKASEKYLQEYLEEQGVTYDEFIDKLIGSRGVFEIFFRGMKRLFF